MAVHMSQQELTQHVQLLTQQVKTLSGALDDAISKIAALHDKCDGAWAKFDERIKGQDVKITFFMENAKPGGGGDKHMKLFDDKALAPAVYGGERKEYLTWSRSMKAYLDSWYSGFRRMLEWAETQETEITVDMVDGTGWRLARESNGQLFNLLLTVTKAEAQSLINNIDPTKGYECWRQMHNSTTLQEARTSSTESTS